MYLDFFSTQFEMNRWIQHSCFCVYVLIFALILPTLFYAFYVICLLNVSFPFRLWLDWVFFVNFLYMFVWGNIEQRKISLCLYRCFSRFSWNIYIYFFKLSLCYGLNYMSLQNSYVEILSPKGDGVRRWSLCGVFSSWG